MWEVPSKVVAFLKVVVYQQLSVLVSSNTKGIYMPVYLIVFVVRHYTYIKMYVTHQPQQAQWIMKRTSKQ